MQEQKIQREHELVEALTDLPPNAEIGEYDYTLYAKTDNLKTNMVINLLLNGETLS